MVQFSKILCCFVSSWIYWCLNNLFTYRCLNTLFPLCYHHHLGFIQEVISVTILPNYIQEVITTLVLIFTDKPYLSNFQLVHPGNKDIRDIPGLAPPVMNNRRLLWNHSWWFKVNFLMNLDKWQLLWEHTRIKMNILMRSSNWFCVVLFGLLVMTRMQAVVRINVANSCVVR